MENRIYHNQKYWLDNHGIKHYTKNIYIDEDGVIIRPDKAKQQYIITKKTKEHEALNAITKLTTITNHCRKNPQQRIWNT